MTSNVSYECDSASSFCGGMIRRFRPLGRLCQNQQITDTVLVLNFISSVQPYDHNFMFVTSLSQAYHNLVIFSLPHRNLVTT